MAVKLLVGEPQKGETGRAIQACNDYLRLGAGRSMPKLLKYYAASDDPAVSKRLGTLKNWSRYFGWIERATLYDLGTEEEINTRRKEVMEKGLSLDFERINELFDLYDRLKGELNTHGFWTTDIKMSNSGKTVSMQVFNKGLIDSLRGVLDDLAKETGGRKQKTELSSDGEIVIKVIEGPRDVR